MTRSLPRVTRVYRNHHLDSTRWDGFEPRDDDVIVSTPYKCGTTWMQMIVTQLIYKDAGRVPSIDAVSPWLDAAFFLPVEVVRKLLDGIRERRCIKSHLALDGLPYWPRVKYIVVGRDPRDVFMSLWNHYGSYTDGFYANMNGPRLVGDPLPRCPDDIHALWRGWISRGWFEWESEGYPFWGNMHHLQTFWDHRDLPNLLLVHYADLKADPAGQIRRIAEFLEIDVTAAEVARVVEATSFDNVKKNARELLPVLQERDAFVGGVDTFVYKGTNGRWREVLTNEDLALYEEARSRVLDPECADWLEGGWLG